MSTIKTLGDAELSTVSGGVGDITVSMFNTDNSVHESFNTIADNGSVAQGGAYNKNKATDVAAFSQKLKALFPTV